MTTDKENKIIQDLVSVAQALVKNSPAGSRLNQFGKAVILLAQVSEDPARLNQAVEELDSVANGSGAAAEVEKLLRDLGIRSN